MITATVTLTKDQLDIAMLSVRDTLDWYRFGSQDADYSDELRAHYAHKAEQCLALEEIISDARKELVMQQIRGVLK